MDVTNIFLCKIRDIVLGGKSGELASSITGIWLFFIIILFLGSNILLKYTSTLVFMCFVKERCWEFFWIYSFLSQLWHRFFMNLVGHGLFLGGVFQCLAIKLIVVCLFYFLVLFFFSLCFFSIFGPYRRYVLITLGFSTIPIKLL